MRAAQASSQRKLAKEKKEADERLAQLKSIAKLRQAAAATKEHQRDNMKFRVRAS